MECGASDWFFRHFSAIPCIGQVADLTVGLGGRVILSEFPELCGVESGNCQPLANLRKLETDLLQS
jgi:altronate hydrolase